MGEKEKQMRGIGEKEEKKEKRIKKTSPHYDATAAVVSG